MRPNNGWFRLENMCVSANIITLLLAGTYPVNNYHILNAMPP